MTFNSTKMVEVSSAYGRVVIGDVYAVRNKNAMSCRKRGRGGREFSPTTFPVPPDRKRKGEQPKAGRHYMYHGCVGQPCESVLRRDRTARSMLKPSPSARRMEVAVAFRRVSTAAERTPRVTGDVAEVLRRTTARPLRLSASLRWRRSPYGHVQRIPSAWGRKVASKRCLGIDCIVAR